MCRHSQVRLIPIIDNKHIIKKTDIKNDNYFLICLKKEIREQLPIVFIV